MSLLLRAACAFAMGFVMLTCGSVRAASETDGAADEPMFVETPGAELAAAAQAANATVPQFRALLASGAAADALPMVKKRFVDGDGNATWLWLMVEQVTDSGFEASVFEAPPDFPALSLGSRHFIADVDVADWAVVIAGVMHGGYSMRMQRARLPEDERASYDEYVGASSYAPLPEAGD